MKNIFVLNLEPWISFGVFVCPVGHWDNKKHVLLDFFLPAIEITVICWCFCAFLKLYWCPQFEEIILSNYNLDILFSLVPKCPCLVPNRPTTLSVAWDVSIYVSLLNNANCCRHHICLCSGILIAVIMRNGNLNHLCQMHTDLRFFSYYFLTWNDHPRPFSNNLWNLTFFCI